jgi:Ran GTPase-activating protein (RanGAP) involved in mRNA processing and transport
MKRTSEEYNGSITGDQKRQAAVQSTHPYATAEEVIIDQESWNKLTRPAIEALLKRDKALKKFSVDVWPYYETPQKQLDVMFKILATILQRNSTITTLSLNMNHTLKETTPAHFVTVLSALPTLTVLESLELSVSLRAPEVYQTLSDALPRLTNLKHLGLVNCDLEKSAAAKIAPAISHFSNLTSLDLSNNAHTIYDSSEENAHIIPFLREGNQEISINDCLPYFVTALKDKPLLKLNLKYTGLTNEGAAEVVNLLTSLPYLEELDIRGNNITKVGISLILQTLIENETPLHTLRIGNYSEESYSSGELEFSRVGCNMIGKIELKKLASFLSTNKTLKTLDMSWLSRVDVEGFQAVAEALKTHPTIDTLELGGEGFGDEHAAILGEVLRTTTSIRDLDLKCAWFTSAGIKALEEAVVENKSLLYLDIYSEWETNFAITAAKHPYLINIEGREGNILHNRMLDVFLPKLFGLLDYLNTNQVTKTTPTIKELACFSYIFTYDSKNTRYYLKEVGDETTLDEDHWRFMDEEEVVKVERFLVKKEFLNQTHYFKLKGVCKDWASMQPQEAMDLDRTTEANLHEFAYYPNDVWRIIAGYAEEVDFS